MKKSWSILLRMIFCCTLLMTSVVACSPSPDSPGGEQPKDPEKPTDDALSSRNPNVGKTAPYAVETLFDTDENIVAAVDVLAYGADSTGQSDSTEAFRAALKQAEELGGGTVWVPAGDYLISDTLTIPSLVTLHGDWNDPDGTDFNGDYGTVIHVITSPKSKKGIFLIKESAGVCGLTVYYPEQSIENVQAYAPTFVLTGDTGLRTMRNITLLNSYIGVSVDSINYCTNFINFKGTCLKNGMEIGSSADVGVFDRVTFSPKYWAGATGIYKAADAAEVTSYCKENGSAALLLHDLEQQQFSRVTIEGYEYGILFSAEPTRWMASGPMTEVNIRDCTYGIYAEEDVYQSINGYAANICYDLTAIDCRCGYIISNSTIEGDVYAIFNGCPKVKDTTGKSMQAYIHLADVTLKGDVYGNVSYTSAGETVDLSRCAMETRSSKSTGRAFEAVSANSSEAEVQAALDRVGAAGGGIVYLPAGNYEISNGLRVPANTEIIGAAASPQMIPNVGTVLWCRQQPSNSAQLDAPALVTLDGDCAGVSGVYFLYADNITAVDAGEPISYYPFAIRGEGKGAWAINCCISGATHGIDFTDCDEHLISSLYSGCFYSHMEVSGNNGIIQNCLANGTILYRNNGVVPANEAATIFPNFFEKYAIPNCTYITVGEGDGQKIYNSFIYGAKHMLYNNGGTNVVGVNICSDNLGSYVIYQKSGSMTVVNAIVTSTKTFGNLSGDMEIYNPLKNGDPTVPDVIYH